MKNNDSFLVRYALFFLSNSKIGLIILLAISGLGYLSYSKFMKREGFPEVNLPNTIINVPYYVNDKQKVESDIVIPIEEKILALEEVKSVQSTVTDNFASIFISFESEISSEDGEANVSDIVEKKVSLPEGVEPNYSFFDPSSMDGESDILIAISAKPNKELSYTTLLDEAQKLAIELEELDLVQSVEVKEHYTERVDPITNQNIDAQTAFNRVGFKDGEKLYFADSISLGIKAKGELDIIKLSTEIREKITQLEKNGLSDIQIVYTADFAEDLTKQIDGLEANIMSGALIVIVSLFLLVSWRASIVSAFFIPTVICGTFLALYVMGYTLNVISLFGLVLVLGLFVDDAIVVIEALDYNIRKGESWKEGVRDAIRTIGSADIMGSLTTMFVFVPIAFSSGMLGEFITLIPITVITALVISVTVALGLIPLVSSKILRDDYQGREYSDLPILFKILYFIPHNIEILGSYLGRFTKFYLQIFNLETISGGGKKVGGKKNKSNSGTIQIFNKVFTRSTSDKVDKNSESVGLPFTFRLSLNLINTISFIFVTAVLLGAVYVGMVYSGKLFSERFNIFPPEKDSNQLLIMTDLPEGSDFQDLKIYVEGVEAAIQSSIPEYITKVGYYGQGEGQSVNQMIIVTLTDYKDRELSSHQISEKLNESIRLSFNTRINDQNVTIPTARASSSGPTPTEYPFVVKIEDSNVNATQDLATDISNFINSVTLKDGESVTAVKISGSEVISRYNGNRFSLVEAKFSDNLNNALIEELKEKVEDQYTDQRLAEFDLTKESVDFTYGAQAELQSSFDSLVLAGLVSLIAIYVLLVFQYNSFMQPIIIFVAIPLMFPGVFPGLYFTDNYASFFVMIGIIGLMGIVINNSIMLVDFANQARAEGKGIIDAVSQAVHLRFRPLLATSITSVAGLAPLAFSDPFWEPLAFTIMFGLISSSILVLFAIPIMYTIFETLSSLLSKAVTHFMGRFN